jgi:glutamate-1-semialdehyde 2,1-aminomutase
MKHDKSAKLFQEAKTFIPGGVNSPVRAGRSVGVDPVFLESGQGARVTDVDGNTYIDYVCSWGPLVLGHAHPDVTRAVTDAAQKSPSFGAPTESEIQLARLVAKSMPSIEKLRFVNSGTEATMSAIRLARAITGRGRVIKFDGCYHGHSDGLLVAAGSGMATLNIPGSPGVPPEITELTMSMPYNDLETVSRAFASHPEEIAAVIVEPVAGNMGVVLPEYGFLDRLRSLTNDYGALLIFDEVITGFRVALGGAQERFGVTPDITCLGKIIGGGLPVGAFGGPAEYMDRLAPEGDVYQAGTLSGNPLAMAAGAATLSILRNDPDLYRRTEELAARLSRGLAERADAAGHQVWGNQIGAMCTLFFTAGPVMDYATAAEADTAQYAAFYRGMLEQGVYLAPSQFEATMVSAAHTDEDVDKTLAVAETVFKTL